MSRPELCAFCSGDRPGLGDCQNWEGGQQHWWCSDRAADYDQGVADALKEWRSARRKAIPELRQAILDAAADFIGSKKSALLTPQQLAARVRSGEFE